LPAEIGNLSNLQRLYLDYNQLTTLPLQLGDLPITDLQLENNPLVFPPPEIVRQGTPTTLEFLRNPPPYPPFVITEVVVAVLLMTVITTFVSSWMLLRMLRRGLFM